MHDSEQETIFRRWMAEHQGLLFKVVRSHEANPEDQQDLLQEVLLQLWRSTPGYSGRSRETTWIYRVALNTAFGWRRSEKRRRFRHEQTLAAALENKTLAAGDGDPTAASDLEQLYSAIRRLPKADASLIVMHLDGLCGREIGEVLGLSENNVAVKLSRARKQLAQIMKGEVR